ncbi:MAG: GH36-type glycosyl hydrolase domain-containing protein, partial [Gemmatimonadaceae bacterium]
MTTNVPPGAPLLTRIFPRASQGRDELLAGPIRGELLGADQLATRARELARSQRVVAKPKRLRQTPLLVRLNETRAVLEAAHNRLTAASDAETDVGPAGDWLLDNFHVVQEHIREVRESLPRGYYRELPELATGTLAGYPRVYEIGITLIAHTEARIDLENVNLFIGAYQERTTLSVGELWAMPAMLRLGLIESVRRMALRTIQRLDDIELADKWAARLLSNGRPAAGTLGGPLDDFVRNTPPLTSQFVARLLHQLRLSEQSFPALLWFEQWIAEEGPTSEEAVARTTERMALTQVMTANSITSLRAIARFDWRVFVERQSVMEQVLRGDPTGHYTQMTFQTRDHYRHVVERIARRTEKREQDVAHAAIELARRSREVSPGDERHGHVGFWLINDGRAELERVTGYRPTWGERVHRAALHHPNLIFVGGIIVVTVLALLTVLRVADAPSQHIASLLLAFTLLPAMDIAVNIVNQLVAAFLPPRVLPKLDLTRELGVPAEYRTAVVIPTLFGSVEAVREALDTIEVQYLANREPNLHFAILSDFTDSPTEHRDGDEAIVAAAVQGVQALNARYAGGDQTAFYLFHRPRLWNPQQGSWMGWERKRGKLAEFNRVLRQSDGGRPGSAFTTVIGDVVLLRSVRYVITLDSDTVLPPDAAPNLIGTIAHPLNRAVYDETLGRVVRGYGILQPRVGVSLPSAHRSLFAAIHSGHPGVDPYTTAVSDVYQDLYGEGSFTGKGIYDVDAFERATHGRFPENTLLSHDLIEGNYARAGLATDIEVYDDYPTRYLTYTRRKHRWIRGDWQLLDWLTPRVPGPNGPERNRLSVLSRWKILDNLRRSLTEIAQLALLVAAWTLFPGSPVRWTLVALGAIAAPWIVSLFLAVVRPPFDKSWRAYYAAVGRDAVTSVQQLTLAIVFLAHQAWVSADAIGRTLWRLFVSRRKLLEWQTASQVERMTSADRGGVWRKMWPAVAIGLVVLAMVSTSAWVLVALRASNRASASGSIAAGRLLLVSVPTILLWILSPSVAQALSKPALLLTQRLSAANQEAAVRYALLHWRFFDHFVSEDTNWLAPDNFQEDPTPVVAMRTSPTNIGLQLMAIATAAELGFISIEEMTTRLERAFRSLERMRRYRGHFYNWYELHDLNVLEPAYISTVDSGNLAGHLIALRQSCLHIADRPVSSARLWRALAAALQIAHDRLTTLATSGAADTPLSFGAVADAAKLVRAARTAFAAIHGDAPDPAAIAGVAAPLEQARLALGAAELPAESLDPAIEWLDWTANRLDDEATRLAALGPTRSRTPSKSAPVAVEHPSLRQVAATSTDASELVARLETIAARAYAYALEMDFRFLFDERRKLFSIGYQLQTHSRDASYYDLLASEARLASFVAIAKNDIPVEHWFRLGRTLTHADGATALVSWSGSMFEYLMPVLVMQSFPFTVLDQTYRGSVKRQIAYADQRDVPWGISESAYNLRDRHLTYQYRAFGIPNLALKRGLGRDLVIAPYATALAVLVDPARALGNLGRLERRGALGRYGFLDALDYTRPDPGERYALVKTYMAHHIGMGLIALANALRDGLWQRRFHADPLVRAAELLLHERIPRRLVLQEPQEARPDEALPDPELERPAVRQIDAADTPQPHIALLGHLPYTIMVSSCGAGYSRYGDLAITRWRADGTRDNTGQFCYVRDATSDRVWSAAYQPTCTEAEWYRALLATDRVTYHRADNGIETRTEIAVVPDDSAEVRRVTVTNNSTETREIELTSYGEIVLTSPDADRAHPAFANLFVETEWHEWCTAITATRRPRSANEKSLWCVHVADAGKDRVGATTCETDRAKFIGRGRTTRDPVALDGEGPLSMTTGAVLDPIFSLRTRVSVAPGRSASVAFTTIVADSRERAFQLADRYHHPHAAQRALDLAWTSTQVELRELGMTPTDAAVFQELAGHLFYPNSALRAPMAELIENRGSQPLLWSVGLSGDWPILLARIDSMDGMPTLRQLLVAHHYWRRRGMMVDLVVLNAHAPTYLQDLNDRITAAIFASSDAGMVDRPGGVFVRRAEILGDDALRMLRATARVHIPCDGRSLARILDASKSKAELEELELFGEDLAPPRTAAAQQSPSDTLALQRARLHTVVREPRHPMPDVALGYADGNGAGREPPRAARHGDRPTPSAGVPVLAASVASPELSFDNEFGGMTREGDYFIRVAGDNVPPAPWVNVIANERGGFIVSERGAGCTWAESSFFYRLTPWQNDPVSDAPGEVIYLRDDDSQVLWSATPAPIRTSEPYVARHTAGASSFEHVRDGIATQLTVGIDQHDAVKISTLRITNRGDRVRHLTLTSYTEWTLGVTREHSQHQVTTSFDPATGAIFARNTFDPVFAQWVAFAAISEQVTSHTGDRREFIGRNGSLGAPFALAGGATPLTGTVGAGMDPCAALQCAIELAPGESRDVVVILGAAATEQAAKGAVAARRDARGARVALADTVKSWQERLGTIAVHTPEPSFDAMMNRWIFYQALSCRMWGRTALYQSSGAYGFRDQLQDCMAFVYSEPQLARAHIIRSAGRQFVEGDVQHWWHPHSGRGVRTKFSDDLAWLPYVVDHYVRITGDASVLDEPAPFLTMRQLDPDEHEVYDLPQESGETGTIYEHCRRALHRACTVGAHGLPLIGIGDWNDGMNRVGVEGKGETVWLAWFLTTTLRSFAAIADARGDAAEAKDFRAKADAYVRAIEETSWDGLWYRRAYFDDGSPLGSSSSDECKIDSIAQSWSVISGAGIPERQEQAMRSFEEHLVRNDARLLMLLTPPFDKTTHDPGYIKGYLPGVRENGAQYTHAALWAVLATALQGRGDRAFELYQMINPLTHASTRADAEGYKVEPYVVVADLYTAAGHLGRGGWTWYTGSASWMYRVGLEAILGFHKRGDTLAIEPCIPATWPEFTLEYRHASSRYTITVK